MDLIPSLFTLVVSFWLMRAEGAKLKSLTETDQAPLTNQQKVVVGLLSFFDPILAGCIFYFGWKKQLPVKARQASLIASSVFLFLLVLIGIGYSVGGNEFLKSVGLV